LIGILRTNARVCHLNLRICPHVISYSNSISEVNWSLRFKHIGRSLLCEVKENTETNEWIAEYFWCTVTWWKQLIQSFHVSELWNQHLIETGPLLALPSVPHLKGNTETNLTVMLGQAVETLVQAQLSILHHHVETI
jgi:hypothetical protein